MELSTHEIAQLTGVTTRTLRHYDAIGLLPPGRIGHNGYRFYDQAALLRLQRILLLRDLGLGLPRIREVLDQHRDERQALRTHVSLLRQERRRLTRQIAAVERTLTALNEGEQLMASTIFDGFDHRQYKEEVEQRWGKDAYERSDAWWEGKSDVEKSEWKNHLAQLNAEWIAAANDPQVTPDSPQAQALAQRHVKWLRGIPGTPAYDPNGNLDAYVRGLAQMYVADNRFAANYGGAKGAEFVRDALLHYADHR